MEASVEKMEAQLKLWSVKIFKLATKIQLGGARPRFEDLVYIDELKALYAIAQSKFDDFMAAKNGERARLRAEVTIAWNELDAAFRSAKP
jgi:hypothetical protein